MGKASAISNVEIADCMLRAGGPVTVNRLLELLQEHHARYVVDKAFVRARLAAFERSPNVICIVNKNTRPATYHMLSVTQEFFRGTRSGRKLDFSHTVIPKKSGDGDNSHVTALCTEIWNRIIRQRMKGLESMPGH